MAAEKALKLNPEYPRTYLLKGQTEYYTSEIFGGDKMKACEGFNTAKEKFEKFTPPTFISAKWRKEINDDILKMCEDINKE